MVDERVVGERGLRVVVAPLQQRVARQALEVPPVLLDVLAVVPLRPRETEHPLLEDRVLAVPEREREAQLVADVGDAGHPVLVPAVRAGARVIVRERVPGVAALGVVLADGAPGALAEVRAPLVPRVRREEVVLGAAGGLGEPGVLGRRGSLGSACVSPPERRGGSRRRGASTRARARRRARRGGRRRCARSARRPRRRRAARSVRGARPTAARRGRSAAASPRFTTMSLRDSPPRQPHATRFGQVSLPSQPRRSPSCHSPSRKTRSRSAARSRS